MLVKLFFTSNFFDIFHWHFQIQDCKKQNKKYFIFFYKRVELRFVLFQICKRTCNINFCFFLCAYCSFSFLIVITAKRPLKLTMLATSSVIPATICSLVFYCVSFVPPFRLLFNFKMANYDVSIAI